MAFLLLFIGVVFADQAVKFWIVTNLTMGQTVEFIPGVLSITREQNHGVAFSLLSGVSSTILASISIAIVLLIIILLITKVIKGRGQRWALTGVIAGAISNALDRLISGYVVDMFKFEFITFGIFNVADIFIVCGIIIFSLLFIISDSNKETAGKKAKKSGKNRADSDTDEDYGIPGYMDGEPDLEYDEKKKFSLDEILEEFYKDSDN